MSVVTADQAISTCEKADANTLTDIIVSLANNVVVRQRREKDSADIVRALNNRKVWDNLTDRIPHPFTAADEASWSKICVNMVVRSGAYDDSTRTSTGPPVPVQYTIAIDGIAVGGIGLTFGEGIYRRTATIGYWLAEEHWGKGVMGAVVPAFVAWSWRTWGVLIRINGSRYARNPGSGKCLLKAGFVEEGTQVASCVKNGIFEDEVSYAALRPGWKR